jgi:GNAT superfamily N-acetyltransferase
MRRRNRRSRQRKAAQQQRSAVMTPDVRAESDPNKRRALQEAITARLPEWFGRPAANLHYAAQAEALPGWVGNVDGRDVALLSLKRHGIASAEIYWMGIDPDYHRHGVGRALVDVVCRTLRDENRKLLFAYSLHPDDPNENYRRTRHFYESVGFVLGAPDHGSETSMAWFVKILTK